MTVTEIIAWADRKYPNQESNANKIIDLNLIHKEIYTKLKRLKHEYSVDETEVTVGGQLEYDLPSDCNIDNVVKVEVETGDSTDEYDEYEYAGVKDTITNGYYFRFAPTNQIQLTYLGDPISYDDAKIKITYYAKPSAITLVTDTPDLDSDYHILLCYALVQTLAAQGHNPDTEIADYYQNKFDEFFNEVASDLSDKFNMTPTSYNQVKEWF